MLRLLSFSTYNDDCSSFTGTIAALKPNNLAAVPQSLEGLVRTVLTEHQKTGVMASTREPLHLYVPSVLLQDSKDSVQFASKCCPQCEGDASVHHSKKTSLEYLHSVI